MLLDGVCLILYMMFFTLLFGYVTVVKYVGDNWKPVAR